MTNRPTGEIGRLLFTGNNAVASSSGCGCECTDCLENGLGSVTDCEHFENMPIVYYSASELPSINNPGKLTYTGNCTYTSEQFTYTAETGTVYTLKWFMRAKVVNGFPTIELTLESVE